jgi:hypothetical protein
MKYKRAQVWVETVVYTLIALTLIGIALAFIKPKIDEMSDKAIIEQSISIMEQIDSLVNSVGVEVSGNRRLIEVGVKKGTLKIDSLNDALLFEIEGKSVYSQPGQDIEYNNMIINTQQKGTLNTVTLRMNYDDYNITYENKEELKELTRSSIPYKLYVENKGKSQNKIIINIEVV